MRVELMENFDVAVIGGGMVGCLSAYYLAQAGVGVAVIEATGIGSQASGNSAGGLNPLHGAGIPGPLSALAEESFRLHIRLWRELEEATSTAFHPRFVKRLFLSFDEPGVVTLQNARSIYEIRDGFSAEFLDKADVMRLEPRINSEVRSALYTEGNAAVEPLSYNQAIAEAAVLKGALIRKARVTNLEVDKGAGMVKRVILDDGQITCGDVVVATGAWANKSSEWLNVPILVEPVKGEMLLMDLPGPHLLHDISLGEIAVYCRGVDGRVWLGATETRDQGYNNEPTDGARRLLLKGGIRLMPAIAHAKVVRQTSGLRPVTPDLLPIIGKAPGWRNVYVATGAGKKGTLISAGMGKAISDLITQGCTSLPIEHARPDRFLHAE
jgi:glycine oxidase